MTRDLSDILNSINDVNNLIAIFLVICVCIFTTQAVMDGTPGNVIISPVSVSTLLALIQQGALNNSRRQLSQVLFSGPRQLKEGYRKLIPDLLKAGENGTLEFANGAFFMEGFEILQEFKKVLSEDFVSHLETVNFSESKEAANTINSWVAKHTHNRIKTLISPESLSSDTRLVLANAIYFKDLWKTPFIEKYTRDESFYTQDGSEIKVPMMHLDGSLKMDFIESLKSQWVEIPFKGDQFSFLVIMPYNENGLDELLKQFTAQHLNDIISNLKNTYENKIYLSLPKFKLSTTTPLVPVLKQLGLIDVFNMNSNINGISKEHLEVSDVIQKAEIEVDEKGVKATAATGKINMEFLSLADTFRQGRILRATGGSPRKLQKKKFII
ncbi:hypothetical protein ANN_03295 [Periplaneta americana]|uniref:Serpin domain-containing protein n=1 Tax=Periplaneta americana TaxID=6978 RepID=A0ABQ8U0A7_PERAM|nr:hypothetical protein ANN_03295 [Periplaneta americana]